MHQTLLACQTAQRFVCGSSRRPCFEKFGQILINCSIDRLKPFHLEVNIFQSVTTILYFLIIFLIKFCVKATVSNWPPFNCDITVFKLASRQVALPHNICKRHQFDCLDIWFIHYFIILSKSSSIRQCLSITVVSTFFCQRFITSNVLAPILNSCLLRNVYWIFWNLCFTCFETIFNMLCSLWSAQA